MANETKPAPAQPAAAATTPVVTADDVRTGPGASAGTGMAGDPAKAAEGKPTPGLSADAAAPISGSFPVLDPVPGTIKQHQPGKAASGNAHKLDHIPQGGWVDHVNIGVDGTEYNAHTFGTVMRPNPRKHQGEEVPKGHTEANPLNLSTAVTTTPTVHPTASTAPASTATPAAVAATTPAK